METKKFKPFDRVLVKVLTDEKWTPDLYSYYDDIKNLHWSIGCGWAADENILPYEGNEHMVGSDQNPDEEVRLEEGEWVIVFRQPKDYNNPDKYLLGKFKAIETRTGPGCFQLHNGYNDYCIPLAQFNGGHMEETKKHILCVKNGKIIKYKN